MNSAKASGQKENGNGASLLHRLMRPMRSQEEISASPMGTTRIAMISPNHLATQDLQGLRTDRSHSGSVGNGMAVPGED